jgi:glycosyltransferase involved in cell wall biosynthesis
MSVSPPRKPRILLFEPSQSASGPSRYVHALLDGIDRDEFGVTVLCRRNGPYRAQPGIELLTLDDDGDNSCQPTQVSGRPLSQDRGSGVGSWTKRMIPATLRLWAGFRKDALKLARVLRKSSCDLLHTNSTGCEESPVAARWARVPRVLGTFHVDSTCDVEGRRNGFTHRSLERISNWHLHQAIAVSEATKRDWMSRTGIAEKRVLTIHNGVDPAIFCRQRTMAEARTLLGLPPSGRLILGAVGRLDVAKGFTYLIDAVAQLRREFPQLLLVLAGQGPLRERLECHVSSLGLSENVRFLGFCQDVKLIYDAIDVFAMPSLSETLGYALLEAMAHERPAVGTMVGGIPEVIVPLETGLLVPPRDSFALAETIALLLRSVELRQRLGWAARLRVANHFNQADMVRKTVDVYRRMVRY